jgi:hypothetical protein
MLSQHKDIESTDDCFELTLKYYNEYSVLIENIIQYYKSKDIQVMSEDIILYEIMYNKPNQSFTILSKYENNNSTENLEKLKICHQSRFIIVLQNQNNCLDTNILDKYIGSQFEPLTLHILFGSIDKHIRAFNNIKLDEFKTFLKEFFKIDYEISLTLKSNNKNINLDKNGYDKKNNTFLTLKQLRLNDHNIIFISKLIVKQKPENADNTEEIENELDEKINCIIRLEDDQEFVEVVKIRQNKTFTHLISKIKKQLNLEQSIRLRKYFNINLLEN